MGAVRVGENTLYFHIRFILWVEFCKREKEFGKQKHQKCFRQCFCYSSKFVFFFPQTISWISLNLYFIPVLHLPSKKPMLYNIKYIQVKKNMIGGLPFILISGRFVWRLILTMKVIILCQRQWKADILII